jgi:hypothetical protein
MSIPLAVAEDITDASGVAPRIGALLPVGVRHRQLRVRTLLAGMMLTLADRRPAHLTEVHAALTGLPEGDQIRLGVIEDWKNGPHQLTGDSAYAHRDPGAWAIPLRAAGAQLVQDLHPSDRGPRGTQQGAIISNGNLYCPCTPRPLLELPPLAPGTTPGRPPRTTSRQPNSPATSSGKSPQTTRMATTG